MEKRSFDWCWNRCPSELFQYCFGSKRWGHWQNDFLMQGIYFWCCWLSWQLPEKSKSYKGGLPLDVRAAISLVYNDLCKQENLSKCLHGRTQKKKVLMEWYGIVYRRAIMRVMIRGRCWGLLLLPMQHPKKAHINFQSLVFVSKNDFPIGLNLTLC